MSIKMKYLSKKDLYKFDKFIQSSLHKYFFVKPWKQLYNVTGENYLDIISDKSTIPDLVIFRKPFNKNVCFIHANNKRKYNKFPRKQFLFKPKKIENYSFPPVAVGQKEEKKEKDEAFAPFEFKSIPKEIEKEYNNSADNRVKNVLFDELQEFMKNEDDSTCETKVKLIYENENEKENDNINNGKEKDQQIEINCRNVNDDKKRKYLNQRNYQKNKFGIPLNINYLNKIRYVNYVDIQEKILQNIQYQNYLNKIRMKMINNVNNNKNNLSSNENKLEGNSNNTQKANDIKTDSKNANNENRNMQNAFSYYKNNEGINEKDEFENYINNIDEILKNYKNKRNWKVVDNRNDSVSQFNNEELYIFLNTIISRKENNNYSISDLEKDFFFNPLEIHEKLKNIFHKDKE